MSEGLGKCSINGCHGRSTTYWPLIGNGVGLCSSHHSNPPDGYYSNLVRASQEPPDDFDIPDEWSDAPLYFWVTKDGDRIPIGELENSHLLNIKPYLERRLVAQKEDTSTNRFDILKTEHWISMIKDEIEERGLSNG